MPCPVRPLSACIVLGKEGIVTLDANRTHDVNMCTGRPEDERKRSGRQCYGTTSRSVQTQQSTHPAPRACCFSGPRAARGAPPSRLARASRPRPAAQTTRAAPPEWPATERRCRHGCRRRRRRIRRQRLRRLTPQAPRGTARWRPSRRLSSTRPCAPRCRRSSLYGRRQIRFRRRPSNPHRQRSRYHLRHRRRSCCRRRITPCYNSRSSSSSN